mmetsp:Transcript_19973/g.47571  ORF Transcript_19973/g.47571 Transcript_19973/m.47571 type:complete len:308 (-) Transcript_19973:767-1690(-)
MHHALVRGHVRRYVQQHRRTEACAQFGVEAASGLDAVLVLGVGGRADGEHVQLHLVLRRQRLQRLEVDLGGLVDRLLDRVVLALLHRAHHPLPTVDLPAHEDRLLRARGQALEALVRVRDCQELVPLAEVPGLEARDELRVEVAGLAAHGHVTPRPRQHVAVADQKQRLPPFEGRRDFRLDEAGEEVVVGPVRRQPLHSRARHLGEGGDLVEERLDVGVPLGASGETELHVQQRRRKVVHRRHLALWGLVGVGLHEVQGGVIVLHVLVGLREVEDEGRIQRRHLDGLLVLHDRLCQIAFVLVAVGNA